MDQKNKTKKFNEFDSLKNYTTYAHTILRKKEKLQAGKHFMVNVTTNIVILNTYWSNASLHRKIVKEKYLKIVNQKQVTTKPTTKPNKTK